MRLSIIRLFPRAGASARIRVHPGETVIRRLQDGIDIVEGMKHFVRQGQLDNLTIRKNFSDLPRELVPLIQAPEVIDMPEATS